MEKILVSSKSFTENQLLMQRINNLAIKYNASVFIMGNDSFETALKKYRPSIILLGLEKLTEKLILENLQLKVVSKYGVGLDNIDTKTLKQLNINLGWTAGVNKRSVSELTLAFTLSHLRNVFYTTDLMKNGIWKKNGGCQLSNCSFGIVGLGHIGSDLLSLLSAFKSKIYYYDLVRKYDLEKDFKVQFIDYEEMLKVCDVISFHVPSNEKSINMFSEKQIQTVKENLLVINTSRGDVVNFYDTITAAKNGKISGFATDVYPDEPFDASPYKNDLNLYFTPHIGGNAKEAVFAMGTSAIDHIESYFISQN